MSVVVEQPIHNICGTLVLLADSLPLFPTAAKPHVMDLISGSIIHNDKPRSAYLGASNGDDDRYYQIFCAAMKYITELECRHIKTDFTEDDLSYLESCDIVLLAGGSVEVGWSCIGSKEIKTRLSQLYDDGKTLVGVSAGAIHLSLFGYSDSADDDLLFPTLAMAPYIVSVHSEKDDWTALRQMTHACNYKYKGLGIAHKSGVILQSDLFYGFGNVVICTDTMKRCSGLMSRISADQPYH